MLLKTVSIQWGGTEAQYNTGLTRRFMRHTATSGMGFFSLIGHFRDEIKALIRQEVELAKAEVSEKLSRLGRNAVLLATGGVCAFAGLIILLASLSSLLAFLFEMAGLQPSLAFFLGALLTGGVCAFAGAMFLARGIKKISDEPLTPEKTMITLKKLKGSTASQPTHPQPAASRRSSNEIAANIDATRKEAGATAEEITQRLKPRYIGQVVQRDIQAHPLHYSVIGAATGLMGFLVLRRRRRNAHAM
jgi:hypothetical protein